MRHLQRRPDCLQQADCEVDALLFSSGQVFPPLAELIREFDLPGQALVCHIRHYVVNGILGKQMAPIRTRKLEPSPESNDGVELLMSGAFTFSDVTRRLYRSRLALKVI